MQVRRLNYGWLMSHFWNKKHSYYLYQWVFSSDFFWYICFPFILYFVTKQRYSYSLSFSKNVNQAIYLKPLILFYLLSNWYPVNQWVFLLKGWFHLKFDSKFSVYFSIRKEEKKKRERNGMDHFKSPEKVSYCVV